MGKSISTCTYCGARSAQVFRAASHRQVSCGGCGAPLASSTPRRKSTKTKAKAGMVSAGRKAVHLGGDVLSAVAKSAESHRASRKQSSRPRSRMSRLVAGAWDVIDDILD